MKRFGPIVIIPTSLMAVYLWTLAPGNFWADSGAFAASNQILGLPYAPGFPLYTVLGRLFNIILPVEPVMASNLFSALTTAFSAIWFYLTIRLFLGHQSKDSKAGSWLATAGTLGAFLTIPIWQSAVRAEVYALQLFLSLLIIFLITKASYRESRLLKTRFLMVAIFVQGLSFTNHSLLALLTIPPILIILWQILSLCPKQNYIRILGSGLILFCLAFSFYLFIPIRSNQNPSINSGQPRELSTAFKSITRTGENWRPDLPVAEPNYLNRTKVVTRFFYTELGGIILFTALLGIWQSLKNHRRLIYNIALPSLLGIALTIWANRFDPANFDIIAYSGLPLILLFIPAVDALDRLKTKYQKMIGPLITVSLFGLAFLNLSGNLLSCDLSGMTGPDRVAVRILDEAPANSILLIDEEDTMLPIWYHYHALKKRSDLILILGRGLYNPAYRNEIREAHPDLIFPADFANYKLTDLSRNLLEFCELNIDRHPIQVEFGLFNGDASRLEPDGYLYQYRSDRRGHLISNPELTLEWLDSLQAGTSDLMTKDYVARTAFNFGIYLERVGRDSLSLACFNYAIETDSDNPYYLLIIGKAALSSGSRKQAIILLQEAAKTGDGCPEADRILAGLNM